MDEDELARRVEAVIQATVESVSKEAWTIGFTMGMESVLDLLLNNPDPTPGHGGLAYKGPLNVEAAEWALHKLAGVRQVLAKMQP